MTCYGFLEAHSACLPVSPILLDKIPNCCYCAAAAEDFALEQAVGMPLCSKSTLPPSRRQRKRIAEIANQFRHRLGLGDSPIHNLFEAVEEIA